MTPALADPSPLAIWLAEVIHNPWIIAYVAGVLTGWHLARRSTRYMLGGRL